MNDVSNSTNNKMKQKIKQKVRCNICLKHVQTVKKLKLHYKISHSKIQIADKLIQLSLLQATPNVIKKRASLKKSKQRNVYLQDDVHISYNDKTILIKNESKDILQVTIQNLDLSNANNKETNNKVLLKKTPNKRVRNKQKKLLQIGIEKINVHESLSDNTGNFYECHCMEKDSPKISSSDTESCSDTGRSFYCNSCGNGFSTQKELLQHEKIHTFLCKICKQTINIQNYRQHFEQHVIKIYACHFCEFECLCKDILMGHLDYHFEQQTFGNILDLEHDYNMSAFPRGGFCLSGNYSTDINSILHYLTSTSDHHVSRNMYAKITCQLCYQELFICDYEKHMKFAHSTR